MSRAPAPASAVFLVYLGLVIVNPLIAPLSRRLGLAEWQIGAVVSATALAVVWASPLLGRLGAVWGRRRTLLAGCGSAALAAVLFALLAQLGFVRAIGGTALFLSLLIVRGAWFGLSEAAVLTNVQAHIAETTSGVRERVRGMAGIGAAQGAARMLGSALGGGLTFLGLLAPLWFAPLAILAAGALVLFAFRGTAPRRRSAEALAVRATDRRVLPFLAVSFGAFAALGFPHILVGFLAQDRLGLGTEAAALFAGLSYVCAGAGMFLAQSFVVPRLAWGPSRLVRAGLFAATAGFAVLVPGLGLVGLIAGMTVTGLGIGVLAPGVNAGVSLAVGDREQGSAAGLVTSANALTLVIAPLSATVLYGASPELPLLIATALSAGAALLSVAHPAFGLGGGRGRPAR
ncbi:MAG: MFS transporter [Pseudoclavibacter sp.]|nr:MFS transporter [Pseudoclavibacter sp.]